MNLHRFRELDSLRGIAAIGIVFWHYKAQFGAEPLFHLFFPFYNAGLILVDFFILLSGFVLAYKYLNQKKGPSFNKLAISRFLRLYPLHFFTLIIVLIQVVILVNIFNSQEYVYEYNNLKHFILNIFLLQNTGLEDGFSFNATSWAVSTIFFVNLLFFLIVSKVKNQRFAISLYILCFLLPFLFFLFITHTMITDQKIIFVSSGILRTMLDFFLGVLLFILIKKNDGKELKLSKYLYDFQFIIFVLILIFFMSFRIGTITGIDLVTACIVFPLILVSSIRSNIMSYLLKNPVLMYIGKISFSIYLIHYPIQLLFRIVEKISGFNFNYHNPWIMLLFFAVVFAISHAFYHTIESSGKKLFNTYSNTKQRDSMVSL
ncbi:MAG: acyltransferase [Patescibacteria group bacterium]